MIVIKTIDGLKDYLKTIKNHSLGFVPTMGALHAGHQSLIQRSKQDNSITIVSIFVNPSQFNDTSDYLSYPKTLLEDKCILEQHKVDCLFIPDQSTMYPLDNSIHVETNHPIAHCQEGIARPGHFSGMLTIVLKLLVLIQPDRAYFGEKDYQQLQLIQLLAQTFFLNTSIIACPTIRESSGLPLSSRNKKLSLADRAVIDHLYHHIQTDDFNDLLLLKAHIESLGITIDYLENAAQSIFLAFTIGTTRLIDNFPKATGPCLSAPKTHHINGDNVL